MYPHRPVLVEEVLTHLSIRPEGAYVDGTMGSGGHAEAILGRLHGGGRLIGVDRDAQILALAKERLQGSDRRVDFCHGNYADLKRHLDVLGLEKVDGVVLDLGLSSLQLDQGERGFSFSKPARLDMRMDPEQELTAEDLVNDRSEQELADLIYLWGEERFARRIARTIVKQRSQGRITMTTELADIVARAVPSRGHAWRGRIHPATRTFQALRIAVNQELDHLKDFLASYPDMLNPQGRVVVISYHSLEDRLVKHTFRDQAKRGVVSLVVKRPLIPSEQEQQENPRSRSAKLRVAERL